MSPIRQIDHARLNDRSLVAPKRLHVVRCGGESVESGIAGHDDELDGATTIAPVVPLSKVAPKHVFRSKQSDALRQAIVTSKFSWERICYLMLANGVAVTRRDLQRMADGAKPFEYFHLMALPKSVRDTFESLMR